MSRALGDVGDLAYPCRVRIAVQWGDVDMMHHVNNVVFFRWFETVRMRYFEEIGLVRLVPESVKPILASTRADYRAQLRYPDTVSIEGSISRIGRTSSVHVYRVSSERTGKLVVEGESTWVCFDYQAEKAVPIPEPVRAAIEAYEGRSYR